MKKAISLLSAIFATMATMAQTTLVNPTITDSGADLQVHLSEQDAEGNNLDQAFMAFYVFKDDAKAPFTFEKSYFQYIEADMTEIPWGYRDTNNYDFYQNSEGATAIYYAGSPLDGFTRLGVQALYHDGDDTYKSAIVWTDGTITTDEGEGGNGGSTDTDIDYPIISNPIGEAIATVRSSVVFYRLGGTDVYSGHDTGLASHYIIGEDGNIYLRCHMGGNDTQNYLKLEPTATERQYVAHLPQLVMVETIDDVDYLYYAYRMEKVSSADSESAINYSVSPAENNELIFTLSDDGTLTLNAEDENVILGLAYSDNTWTGFGDALLCDMPADGLKVTLPENAQIKKYVMSYEWGNWSEFGRMKKYVDAAIVGDEIYINNPYNNDPEQWFKGVIADGKVTFTCGQLMGLDPDYGRYLYFRGGVLTKGTDGYYTYADADQLVFDFDETSQSIAKNDAVSIYVSRGFGQRGYNTNYDFPSFEEYVETVAGLQDPSWYAFSPEGSFSDFGYAYAQVVIPATDIEGNELNTDNLYYSIYIGDSTTPYVFEASTYTNDLTEDITEIPYNYNGFDFYPYSVGSEIHAFFTYFSIDNLRMGVQSIFYDAKGNVHKSNIVYCNEGSGVELVKADDLSDDNAPIYNMMGRRVNANAKGLLIKNGKKIYVK